MCIFINMGIKKIIREEMDDFDFVRDINPEPLTVGNLIFISPIGTDVVVWPRHDRNSVENYIVLRITDVDHLNVSYETLQATIATSDLNASTDIQNARHITKSGYWRFLDPSTPITTLSRSRHFLPYIMYDGNKV